MTSPASAPTPLPDDDPARELLVAEPESPDVAHIALAGNIYSILVTGRQTAGRYCLIDMQVPAGGGPPPHRHDFEEMFTLLEGEIDFIFRGETRRVAAGSTVNIPANAPHHFRNNSGRPARMLCMCTPAGQEEYFALCGDPVDSPNSPPPHLSDEQQDQRRRTAADLAPRFATELLPADGK
ncbi:cupin domain-containing protein [Streptomyces sp. NPDC046985]|uniref:cupin domain-containing protein n=1 Tax=Streptomyces sp. NPDC046985 TaxID=3155377 RepID=UPI0033F0E325